MFDNIANSCMCILYIENRIFLRCVFGQIHVEIDIVGLLFSDSVVQVSEPAFLPEKVAIETPKNEGGDVSNHDEFGVRIVRGECEQSRHKNDAPAFEQKRIRRQSIDDPLNKFEMFELSVQVTSVPSLVV